MNSIIEALVKAPQKCVIGIINHDTKEFIITYTHNLKARIGAIIDQYGFMIFNGDGYINTNVEVAILERAEGDAKDYFVNYYVDKYINLGYKSKIRNNRTKRYNRVSVQYDDYLRLVRVVLYTQAGEKEIVGLFNDIASADKFVAEYYCDRKLINKVVSVDLDKRLKERDERSVAVTSYDI